MLHYLRGQTIRDRFWLIMGWNEERWAGNESGDVSRGLAPIKLLEVDIGSITNLSAVDFFL